MAKKKSPKGMWVPQAENTIQFKVTLRDITPPIWRQLLLPDNFTLGNLHHAIQIAMGWENCHLHAFKIDGVHYTSQESSEMDDMDMENEDVVLLRRIVTQPKQKFTYEYDFGDSWGHEIVVEKMSPFDPQVKYPVCLAGARACPPEDCGGAFGFCDILDALKAARKTERQKELLEWVGDEFDPERFDLDAVNRCLAKAWK